MSKFIEDIEILLNSLESGHIILDEDLKVYFYNRWLSVNTQIKNEDIIGKNLIDVFPNIDKDILIRRIKTAFLLNSPTFYSANSIEPFIAIKRNRVSNTSLEHMQQQVTITPYDATNNMVMISIYDISEVYEIKLSLSHEIQKVNSLNKALELQKETIDKNIMILRSDTNGIISDVSTLFCEFYGYTKEELLGKSTSILSNKKVAKSFYDEIWQNITEGKSWDGEIQNITKDGTLKWTQISINPIMDDSGNIVEFSAFYHDITNKKLLEELYIRDTLTGLYNRAYFEKIISSLEPNQRKTDLSFALVIVDIDLFKSINDTYGHQVGDKALKGVANILYNNLRADDIVARWGGEEFVIMLKNVDLPSAITIANKLRVAVLEATIIENKSITCSFGISLYDKNSDINEVFQKADKALYEAKNSGRNRVAAL